MTAALIRSDETNVFPRLLEAKLGDVVGPEIALQVEARRVVLGLEIVIASKPRIVVVVRRFFRLLRLDGLGCRVCGLRRASGNGLPNDFSSLTPKRRLHFVEEPHALLLLVGGPTRLHEPFGSRRWRKSELRPFRRRKFVWTLPTWDSSDRT